MLRLVATSTVRQSGCGAWPSRQAPTIPASRLRSTSLSVFEAEGASVRAYDPKVNVEITAVEQVHDAISAAKDADLLLIATEWSEFRSVDLRQVRDAMRGSDIVDSRNILDRRAVERLGMNYSGVGR